MGKRDILLRLDEAAYEQLRKTAFESRLSMSDVLRQGLDLRLRGSGCASCAETRTVLAKTAARLGKMAGELQSELRSSPGLPEELFRGSWDDLLDGGER